MEITIFFVCFQDNILSIVEQDTRIFANITSYYFFIIIIKEITQYILHKRYCLLQQLYHFNMRKQERNFRFALQIDIKIMKNVLVLDHEKHLLLQYGNSKQSCGWRSEWTKLFIRYVLSRTILPEIHTFCWKLTRITCTLPDLFLSVTFSKKFEQIRVLQNIESAPHF